MTKNLTNLMPQNPTAVFNSLLYTGSAIAESFARYGTRKQDAAVRIVDVSAPILGKVSEKIIDYTNDPDNDYIALILKNDDYTPEEKIKLEEETIKIKTEEQQKKWQTFRQYIFPCILISGATIGIGFTAYKCISIGLNNGKEIALKELSLKGIELKNQAIQIRWSTFENIITQIIKAGH